MAAGRRLFCAGAYMDVALSVKKVFAYFFKKVREQTRSLRMKIGKACRGNAKYKLLIWYISVVP